GADHGVDDKRLVAGIGPGDGRHDVIDVLDAHAIAAAGPGKGDIIGIDQTGGGKVVWQTGYFHFHFDEAELAIVENNDLDRPIITSGGNEIAERHIEAAVTAQRPHLATVGDNRRPQRRRQAGADGTVIETADHAPFAGHAHLPRHPYRTLADING